MGELPDFIDQIDEHSRQMYLVSRAMYEDTRMACIAFYADHFKTPEKRSKDFLLEGLAWAASAGASEAFRILEEAEHHLWFHRDTPKGERFGLMDSHGQIYASYRVIQEVYRAMRSHGMLRTEGRSQWWEQVSPKIRGFFDRDDF